MINNIYAFQKFYIQFDECLGEMLPMCASEIIFSSVIFNHFLDRCQNLRFDLSKHELQIDLLGGKINGYDGYAMANIGAHKNAEDYVVIILDPKRKEPKYCL